MEGQHHGEISRQTAGNAGQVHVAEAAGAGGTDPGAVEGDVCCLGGQREGQLAHGFVQMDADGHAHIAAFVRGDGSVGGYPAGLGFGADADGQGNHRHKDQDKD